MTAPVITTDFSQSLGLITLNRPEVRNAFNADVIVDLKAAFDAAVAEPGVRAILLSGAGTNFSAGGDLAWMKQAAHEGDQANKDDAGGLADMLVTIRNCPKPVIAAVHGPVMGGGCGLTACADIVIAAQDVFFAFSEVKLGLTPATISPFVIEAIGRRWARRLFQTGERVMAELAKEIGMVQEIVPTIDDARARAAELMKDIAAAGPEAVGHAKNLVLDFAGRPINDTVMSDAASRIAARRASDEGQEGMGAFLEKRPASWIENSGN